MIGAIGWILLVGGIVWSAVESARGNRAALDRRRRRHRRTTIRRR